MFEKEAIRHAFEVTIGLDCLIKPAEEFTYEELNDHLQEKADDFQDGAKFGYNKAKEEMQKNGLALQSDMDKTIEQNIALKKQIEKMKCCQNCKKFNNLSYDCNCAEVCEEWEIKEND